MKSRYELSNSQKNDVISWKENHLTTCHEPNYIISFSEGYSNIASIKCLKCGSEKQILGEYDKSKFDKRIFFRPIFLGSGSWSENLVDKLHARLDYAISMLGGQQQNGGMGTEYSEKEEQETRMSIIEVVKDIKTALYFWEHK